MSINAEFVTVRPDEIASLAGDPFAVATLFAPEGFGGDHGDRRRLSIDKAWHGAHYLLTGDAESTVGALGPVILGGVEIGDDEGYGPARYFSNDQVRQLSAALDEDRLDGEIQARYQPQQMVDLSIYPGGWDEGSRGWLFDAIGELRAFFRDAAADGDAVITCLV